MIKTYKIDELKRTIAPRESDKYPSVVIGDKSINGIEFEFPDVFENFDLYAGVKYVSYVTPEGQEKSKLLTEINPETGLLLWKFDDTINKGKPGQVAFAIIIDKVESEETVKTWVSLETKFSVVKSLAMERRDDPEEEVTYAERLAAAETELANMRRLISGLASGAPAVAATAAAMTDTEAIYIYTGSETGYSSGHLYYYDGSAWVDFGQYGAAATDSTLSIQGAPADAKATGDEIEQIKEDLSAIVLTNLADGVAMRAGIIKHADGGSASGNFLYSGYVDISGCSKITYMRSYLVTSNVPAQGMAFYDSSKAYISGIPSGNGVDTGIAKLYTANVPENAMYARFTLRSGETLEVYDTDSYEQSIVVRVGNAEEGLLKNTVSVDHIANKVEPINLNTNGFIVGNYIRYATGVLTTAENFYVTDYIDVSAIERILYSRLIVNLDHAPSHGMAFYDSSHVYISGIANGFGYAGVEDYIVSVPENAVYARFCITSTYKDSFYVYDAEQAENSILSRVEKLEAEDIKSVIGDYNKRIAISKQMLADKTDGKMNAVARMMLLTDTEWTPIKPVPKQYRVNGNLAYGSFAGGVPVVGFPYASQLRYELWIGKTVSFETIVSALYNPNSVMYDFARANDNTLYRPGAWYSVVCSKAVAFALGLRKSYATGQFSTDANISKVADAGTYTEAQMQVGDILEKPGTHTALVTDIVLNEFGDVSQIEVGEATTPVCRRKRWYVFGGGADNFFTHFDGYNLLRYSLIGNIPPTDYAACFPYVSETLALNHGNRANYILGADTVKLTLVDKVSNTIVITKDGTQYSTIDVTNNEDGDEITLSLSEIGYYDVNFDSGAAQDTVSLCLADATVSYADGVVSFASNIGEIYHISTASGSSRAYVAGFNPSAADIAAGEMSITVGSSVTYIHVLFKTRYGIFCKEIAV